MKFIQRFTWFDLLLVGLSIGFLVTVYVLTPLSAEKESVTVRPIGPQSSVSMLMNTSDNPVSVVSPTSFKVQDDATSTSIQTAATDYGDYRQLLPALQEIANAQSHALYAVAGRQLEALDIGLGSRVLTKALFQRWGQVDVQAAFDWVEDEILPHLAHSGKQILLEDAISALSTFQPTRTSQWLGQLEGGQTAALRALVLEDFAKVDIEQTLLDADESEKPWLSAQHAGKLAETDPLKAYEWAIALPDETSRNAALSELVWRWADTDIQGLSDHIGGVTDPDLQRQMYNTVGGQLVEYTGAHDPQAAMAWVDEQPSDVQHELRETAFERWIDVQPELALDWLRDQSGSIEAQSLQSLAIPYVVERDIDLALSMFHGLHPSAQIEMTDRVISELSYQRPGEINNWVASISDPHVRAVANSSVEDLGLLSRSESLIDELDYKTGPERTQHLHTIMRVLGKGDPDRFSEWLHSDRLSEQDHWVLSSNAPKGNCG